MFLNFSRALCLLGTLATASVAYSFTVSIDGNPVEVKEFDERDTVIYSCEGHTRSKKTVVIDFCFKRAHDNLESPELIKCEDSDNYVNLSVTYADGTQEFSDFSKEAVSEFRSNEGGVVLEARAGDAILSFFNANEEFVQGSDIWTIHNGFESQGSAPFKFRTFEREEPGCTKTVIPAL